MKLAKLEAAERSMRKAKEALQAGAKLDPALAPVAKQVSEAWDALWEVVRDRELQAARKADKGVVLWTVFSPIGNSIGVREVRRTSHRAMTCYHWTYRGGDEGEMWSESARSPRIWDPWQDLGAEMRRAA